MILVKLFAGQQWRHRHREQAYGNRVGKEREGQTDIVAWKHLHYHM